MQHFKTKLFLLLFGFLFTAALCSGTNLTDGYSLIQVKEAQVQGCPKGSSILASIDGHTLSIVFLENLGHVYIEVSHANGNEAQAQSTPTPNGVDFYIPVTGSYVVTFTLPNGDVYFGVFEVTD